VAHAAAATITRQRVADPSCRDAARCKEEWLGAVITGSSGFVLASRRTGRADVALLRVHPTGGSAAKDFFRVHRVAALSYLASAHNDNK